MCVSRPVAAVGSNIEVFRAPCASRHTPHPADTTCATRVCRDRPRRPLRKAESGSRTSLMGLSSLVYDSAGSVAGVKAIMADQSLHQYRNTSLEHVLAHVNCQGMSQIFVCRMAIHAALRLVGHDSPSAWVLWERLGHYWRAEGEAYYAIQCFRKALTLEPRRQTIVYNVAMVLYNLDFCEDAHALLKPLAEANPNILYINLTLPGSGGTCQGYRPGQKSHDVRAKFGDESRSSSTRWSWTTLA